MAFWQNPATPFIFTCQRLTPLLGLYCAQNCCLKTSIVLGFRGQYLNRGFQPFLRQSRQKLGRGSPPRCIPTPGVEGGGDKGARLSTAGFFLAPSNPSSNTEFPISNCSELYYVPKYCSHMSIRFLHLDLDLGPLKHRPWIMVLYRCKN